MFRLSAYDEWYPTKQGFSLTGPFLNDFLDFIEQFDFTKEFSKVNEDLCVKCTGNTVTFMMQKLLGVTVITLEEQQVKNMQSIVPLLRVLTSPPDSVDYIVKAASYYAIDRFRYNLNELTVNSELLLPSVKADCKFLCERLRMELPSSEYITELFEKCKYETDERNVLCNNLSQYLALV